MRKTSFAKLSKTLKLSNALFVAAIILMGGELFAKKSPAASKKVSKDDAITVLPVKGLKDDFIMGVDISSLISVEESGGSYYDAQGNKADLLALLKSGGANCVRIRVWNDPYNDNKNGYGGGNNDIDKAVAIGKRATDAGFGVLIDFHYSDFWADPKKQTAPKAWQNYTIEQKRDAIKDFTTDCLKRLKDGGVKVTMVQVGNEINNGMCGERDDDKVFSLVKAGSDAVRQFDSNIQIVVHYTDPLAIGYLELKASLLDKYGVDYDVLGTSYYPFWHGKVEDLTAVLEAVSSAHNKKIIVAETSYPFTEEDGDGFPNVASSHATDQVYVYPISVEGQAVAVRDVIEAVSNVKNGIGIFYWEPAWIPAYRYDRTAVDADAVLAKNADGWEKYGSGWASSYAIGYDKEVTTPINGGTWDNQALFDFDGKALESLNLFKYARTGSKGKKRLLKVDSPVITELYGAQISLPKSVKCVYNDGSVKMLRVKWDAAQLSELLSKGDVGDHVISGTLSGGAQTMCTVRLVVNNLLSNGSFETGDLSDWEVDNPSGKGWPKVDKNEQSAREGSCYFTAWDADGFDMVISQEVTDIASGNYRCFASFEGTGIVNPSGTRLEVVVHKKDGTENVLGADVDVPNEWKKFFRANIPAIHVDGDIQSLTVRARIKASGSDGGAWIVMDDVNLFLME